MVKVSGILCHLGVQLILASNWARSAILEVGQGRGGNVFISSVSSLSFPFFFLPQCASLSSSLLSLLSLLPFSGMTQNDPQWLTCHLTPTQSINITMGVFHFSKNHSCKLEGYSDEYFSLLFKIISPGNPFCRYLRHF